MRLSSVVSVSLCVPSMLSHESALRSCVFAVVDRDPSDVFPPTATDRTFDDPSSKSDVMRTLALGNARYGSLSFEFCEYPIDVVDRITDLKYAE